MRSQLIRLTAICILLSLVLTPVSQIFYGKLHIEPAWAAELGVEGPIVDGNVVATGINFLKFFRSPYYYLSQHWEMILANALVGLLAAKISLSIGARHGKDT